MSPIAINKLPDELLAMIFVFFAEDVYTTWCWMRCMSLGASFSDEQFAYFVCKQPHVQKIQLLTVCRRWHSVATNSPSFWRCIVVGSHQSTQRQLQLSKEAPLDVYTTLPRPNQKQRAAGLSLVLEDLHRIRDLTVCAHGRQRLGHEPEELYMDAAAPILRSLAIHHFCNNHENHRDHIIREIAHGWNAPRLRHYASHGGQEVLSWTSPGTHPALRWKDTLTSFIWLPEVESPSICPSAEALLEVVHQLSCLHTLQVAFSPRYPVQPLRPLAERAKVGRVRMSALRRLMLHGNLQSSFDIMDHLDYSRPLTQLVVIAGHPKETLDPRETIPLTDLFAEHLATVSTNPSRLRAQTHPVELKRMRTLYIGPDELKNTSIEMQASSKLLNQTPDYFPSRSQDAFRDIACNGMYTELELCLVLPQRILRKQFEALFDGITLCEVEKLEVLGNPPYEPSNWPVMAYYVPTKLHPDWSSKVFSLLNNVHTLRVHEHIDPHLLESYLLPSTQDLVHVQHNFPRLRLIRLDGVGFQDQVEDGHYSFSGTLEDLLQLFERRSNAGFVVENMTLLDSSVPLAKEELTMLRQHLVSFLVTSGVSTDLDDELEKDMLYSVPKTVEDAWDVVHDPNAERLAAI